jgi:hypothetical protein
MINQNLTETLSPLNPQIPFSSFEGAAPGMGNYVENRDPCLVLRVSESKTNQELIPDLTIFYRPPATVRLAAPLQIGTIISQSISGIEDSGRRKEEDAGTGRKVPPTVAVRE